MKDDTSQPYVSGKEVKGEVEATHLVSCLGFKAGKRPKEKLRLYQGRLVACFDSFCFIMGTGASNSCTASFEKSSISD